MTAGISGMLRLTVVRPTLSRSAARTAETADEYVPVENDSHAVSLKAAHPLTYTLTYDVTGDLPEGYTAPAKQTLVKGSSYTVADVPASVSGSKDGVNGTFSFDGWKKDDGTVLTGEQKLTADLTLHGVWTFTKNSSGGGTDPIEWNVSLIQDRNGAGYEHVDFQCDSVPAQRRGKAGIGCGIRAG